MVRYKKIIAVSVATIRNAERTISCCERCDRTSDTPFSQILASTLSLEPDTEFLMSESARCPGCGADILEHTLVEIL